LAGENVELLTLECRSSNGVHLLTWRAGAREELARGELDKSMLACALIRVTDAYPPFRLGP
jgi:hypothetical protein